MISATMFYSEADYHAALTEETAAPYGGYGNAIAQEAADYHAAGKMCPFDCGARLSRQDDEWERLDEEQRRAALTPAERLAEDVAYAEWLAYAEKERREPRDPWNDAPF